MSDLYLKIPEYLKDSRNSALCIITSIKGTVPGKAGAKMIVFSDEKIDGTVGGGVVGVYIEPSPGRQNFTSSAHDISGSSLHDTLPTWVLHYTRDPLPAPRPCHRHHVHL